MATAQMGGRHYYISQHTFTAVQRRIWDILLNFALSMEYLYEKYSFIFIDSTCV